MTARARALKLLIPPLGDCHSAGKLLAQNRLGHNNTHYTCPGPGAGPSWRGPLASSPGPNLRLSVPELTQTRQVSTGTVIRPEPQAFIKGQLPVIQIYFYIKGSRTKATTVGARI